MYTSPQNKIMHPITYHSYKILNPRAAEAEKEPKKIAQVILDAVHLDAENYRLGNTKAWQLLYSFYCDYFFKLCLKHFVIPYFPDNTLISLQSQ